MASANEETIDWLLVGMTRLHEEIYLALCASERQREVDINSLASARETFANIKELRERGIDAFLSVITVDWLEKHHLHLIGIKNRLTKILEQ